MADNEKGFPKIAEANWWKIRDIFKQRVPAVMTSTYIATSLSMTEQSAKANIIGPFKKLGIVDETGKPTDLAYDWRDDAKYPGVCEALVQKLYPQELRDLFHSPESDDKAITSWFMNYCRCGEPAARMFATFYKLLLKAEPIAADVFSSRKAPSAPRKNQATPSKIRVKKEQSPIVPEAVAPPEAATEHRPETGQARTLLPEIHIDIQLHISPESTAEQIDKIFESMAKHLKSFKI